MAMITAEFTRAISKQIYQPAVRVKADKKHWDWEKLFSVKSSDSAYEQGFRHTGIGPAVVTGEMEPAYYGRMRELATETWTHSKYTLGSFVSKELLEDNRNLPEFIGNLGEMVGEGLSYIVDYTVAQHLNRAFNPSYALTYDSTELCGTHTLQKAPSTTVSNKMTSSSINYDSIWLAINYYEYQLYTHEYLPMTATPKYLVYHPSQEKVVRKILETDGEPDTTDNNKNTLLKYGLRPLPCRFLTSTYWFLTSDQIQRDALFYWRVRQETTEDKDFDRDAMKFKSRIRFSSKFADWFSILGNSGT